MRIAMNLHDMSSRLAQLTGIQMEETSSHTAFSKKVVLQLSPHMYFIGNTASMPHQEGTLGSIHLLLYGACLPPAVSPLP